MRITPWAVAAVLCAACGGGGGQHDNPDAPHASPDAIPPDASAPDAVAVGSIQVRTESRCCSLPPGSPAAGVSIYVIAPDGTLASTTVTDDLGSVTIDDVVAGSAVTAAYPPTMDGNPTMVTTFLAVEPGDTLVFGERYAAPFDASTGGHFMVTFPPIAPATTAIAAWLPCGVNSGMLTSSPQQPYIYTACERSPATVPIIATNATGRIVESAVLRDIDLAIGGTYTIGAWIPAPARTVTATVPATVPEASFMLRWRYPTSLPTQSETATITASHVASASFSAPDGDDAVAATAYLYRDGLGMQGHTRTFPADLASIGLPITDLPWIATPELSLADQRLSWTQEGAGGDAVIADIRYVPAGASEQTIWTVIAPAGGGEVSWANFPAQVPAPRAGDFSYEPGLRVTDLGTASSYRELRAAPEWQIYCPMCAVRDGEMTSAAQVAANNSGLD